jgi:hypothetical protein
VLKTAKDKIYAEKHQQRNEFISTPEHARIFLLNFFIEDVILQLQ